MFNTQPCILAVLIAGICTPFSYAATSNEQTLVVSAAESGAAALPPFTNSATKSAVPESKTPQVINTISSQEITARHANSLNEVLRYAPGVSTENRGATSYMSEYKIRGFTVDNTFYDGLQLPYNVTGNTKASIDPILIDHVDILKGPASVLYGNGSPGGLVNIQGKKPQKEQKTEVGFNSGSRSLREGYIDSTGAIANSDWSYRFIGKASARDDQPRTSKSENYLVAPSLTWQPSDNTRLTLEAQYQDTPSLTPSDSLPLSVLNADTSRRTYAGDRWSGFKQRQWMLGYSFEHQFDNGWGVAQKARYFDVDTHQRSIYATGLSNPAISNSQLDRFAYTTDESLKSFNIDNQVTKQWDLGDWKHHLLAGVDYQRLSSHFNYQYGTSAPGIDLSNPDYGQVNESALGLYTAQLNRLSYNQTGYYFQDQVEFGNLNLIAGLRYDDYRSINTNYLSNDDKSWVAQHRLTKRLGALYTFDNGIAPFISYSEGFKPVSPTGNLTSAKPTTSRQLEGGVKYLMADYATTLTASVFNIRQKNVLTSDANRPVNYRQTGEIESEGAELSLESRPTDNISIIANYAYTHALNTRDDKYQGKRPTQVAENSFNLWGDYRFDGSALRGLTVGGGARYTGPTEISMANDQGKLGGNTQFDLAVSYNLAAVSPELAGVTLKASAQNLTNKETFTCYDTNSCWIGRDRTWQAGVSYSF